MVYIDIMEVFDGYVLDYIQHALVLCTPWYFVLPESYFHGQVQTALDLLNNKDGGDLLKSKDDKAVWKKIVKSEYGRCAIVESYESIKHILVYRILRLNSPDQIMVKSLFEDHIDRAINQRKFSDAFTLSKLPEVHKCVLTLVENILKHKTDDKTDDKTDEVLFERFSIWASQY